MMRTQLVHDDPAQLQLHFEGPLQNADQLLAKIRSFGLNGIVRCRLTRNRAVMVSFSKQELRVHEAFLQAPNDVIHAIAVFVGGRTRAERRAAQQKILSFPVHTQARPPVRRPGKVSKEDAALIQELTTWHQEYNRRYFDGELSSVIIRVSGRMKSRLGQYTAKSSYGEPAEIAISRGHIRRHGWAEALHTLLHEMVHQWQAEQGLELDHGRSFRTKAKMVGIAPHARREVARPAKTGRVISLQELLLKAARRL